MERINPERFRLLAEQARAGDKGAQSELLRICEKHQLGRRIQAQAMPESYSEESGQFDMTISSGTPVEAFDYETWEYIPRIIIAKGMELRPGRDSIPLLDSHDASTIGAILGRISRIRQEGNRVVGTVAIDRESARGREAEQKVKAGIVTDNSAGFDIIKKRYIPQNEYVTIEGQTYSGPLQIVEQSILYEASLCPIGLDDFALVQARNTTPIEGVQKMEQDKPTGAPPNAELKATPAPAAAQVVDLDEQRREAQAAERERVLTIQSIGKMAGLEPEAVAEAVEKGTPVAEFQKLATKKFTEQNTVKAPAVTVERDQQQQFLDSAADGYLARAGVLQSYSTRYKPGYKPNPAHVEFSRASVVGIMREGLRLFGQSRNTHLMSDAQVVREFLTQGRGPSVFHGDTPHVHTTGVLTNVLGEIAYKSLMIGYAVANTTYQLWTRKVSLANFYTHTRVALSEAPSLELNPENAEIQEGLMNDRKETIQLATYAGILSLTEEALVNDDTSALVRVPQLLGTSASLVPNRLVYRLLKANGNLSDGSALFNTTDGTLASSSAAISVTSVGVALAAMMNQKGALAADANGEQTCLNIRPRFLIVGPSKYTIARQFITSVADPASNNSAVVNPFAGALELITDAELEQGTSSSTTAWFLAADPNAIDTIEVGFLDGVDAPSMASQEGFSYRGIKYAVKLHCAAAAIDRKGLFKNSGA